MKLSPSKSFMEAMQTGRIHVQIEDTRVDIGSTPITGLIQLAYGIDGQRIKGPGWISEAFFDVAAKLPEGSSKAQVPAMLKAMLAERFKMIAHIEKRTMPGYELVRDSGSLKLTPSTGDPTGSGCPGGREAIHNCKAMSMAALASLLSELSVLGSLGGPTAEIYPDGRVVDATHLEGRYDFTFRYGVLGGRGRGAAAEGGEPDSVRVVDGLKEIGLKLIPAKLERDFLIIDQIERTPTEN